MFRFRTASSLPLALLPVALRGFSFLSSSASRSYMWYLEEPNVGPVKDDHIQCWDYILKSAEASICQHTPAHANICWRKSPHSGWIVSKWIVLGLQIQPYTSTVGVYRHIKPFNLLKRQINWKSFFETGTNEVGELKIFACSCQTW